MRKKATWTAEMRMMAKADGDRGWSAKTPEQQAAARELLARHRGKQNNRSKRARAAQRKRAREAFYLPMSSEKAGRLADMGMLKREPLPAQVAPVGVVAQPVAPARAPYIINGWVAPEGFPREEDYAEGEWMPAVNRWHAADGRRKAGL